MTGPMSVVGAMGFFGDILDAEDKLAAVKFLVSPVMMSDMEKLYSGTRSLANNIDTFGLNTVALQRSVKGYAGIFGSVPRHLARRVEMPGQEKKIISTEKGKLRSKIFDFILEGKIYIETKGRFLAKDRSKHLLIQKQYPDLDLRFVFTNSRQKLYKGSKTTYAAWCEKHGFLYAERSIPETWMKNNVDNIVSRHVRAWLEIPISGTLESLSLTRSKYGLSFIKVSTKALQCRVNFRTKLSQSPNADIRKLREDTCTQSNITYDQYKSSRDAIKAIRQMSENKIVIMSTQGLVMKAIWEHAWTSANNHWHKALCRLPTNIYSFVTRYLNNSLANGTNTLKWGTSQTSSCGLCGGNETLGHVIAGCGIALIQKRYTWRHDSVLKAIAIALSPHVGAGNLYCDCDPLVFRSPSIITGSEYRPDLVIVDNSNLLVLELTVGYETNLESNFKRKDEKYKTLFNDLRKTYRQVNYVNLSMGSIGTIYKQSKTIKDVFKNLGIDENEFNHMLKKIIEIAIRCTYYVFCRRGKDWDSPNHLIW